MTRLRTRLRWWWEDLWWRHRRPPRTPASVSQFSQILTDTYTPALREQLNRPTLLARLACMTDDEWDAFQAAAVERRAREEHAAMLAGILPERLRMLRDGCTCSCHDDEYEEDE